MSDFTHAFGSYHQWKSTDPDEQGQEFVRGSLSVVNGDFIPHWIRYRTFPAAMTEFRVRIMSYNEAKYSEVLVHELTTNSVCVIDDVQLLSSQLSGSAK